MGGFCEILDINADFGQKSQLYEHKTLQMVVNAGQLPSAQNMVTL